METLNSVEQLARALLYEGFLLYPYRLSSVKNQQRWNFGLVWPEGYVQRAQTGERSMIQTECFVEGSLATVVSAHVRFLQQLPDSVVERQVPTGQWPLSALVLRPIKIDFAFAPVGGAAQISATQITSTVFKLTATVANTASFQGKDREAALCSALISTHTLLAVSQGAFCSLIDPPEHLAEAAAQCRNVGAWPVLIGPEGQRAQMLSAPIILYDYPRLAPESRGDLFDNTEIDEILSLRVLTLTDTEKREMRSDSERSRELLDRTEALSPQDLLHLHGRLEADIRLKKGDRVRLRPKRRADAFDIILAGKTATVSSVEQDVDNRTYVCVTVDDDPGKDLGLEAKPGHRFFFGTDEVEAV